MLQKGDIIKLKKGHKVYFQLPKNIKDYCTDIAYHEYEALKDGDEGFEPNYFEKEMAKQFEPGDQGMRGIVGGVVGKTLKIVDSFDASTFIKRKEEGGKNTCFN